MSSPSDEGWKTVRRVASRPGRFALLLMVGRVNKGLGAGDGEGEEPFGRMRIVDDLLIFTGIWRDFDNLPFYCCTLNHWT